MKKIKVQSVLFVMCLAAVSSSCSDDGNNKKPVPATVTKNALVTEVKGPVTGKINVELTYDVTFLADNKCGIFNKFVDAAIGNEKGLQVQAVYSSVTCDKSVPELKKAVYKFKSAVKGVFSLKFKKSQTEFITQKVLIE